MTIVVLLCIAALLLFGARLFVVVGVATMLCFAMILGEGLDPDKLVRIVNKMEGLTTKNVFLSIPMFVAAGTVMTRGGMAARLIRIARAFVGFLPGGLAIASIVACMIFAAISGSSPVTLVAVGTVMFPALVAGKYPRDAAMGLLMTAGSLGCLLPPSVAMLVYSISVSGSSGVDPSDLFLAGSIPALSISGLLAVYAFYVGKKSGAPRQPFTSKEMIEALKEGGFALALPFIVVGGIYSGQFTPTEAGSVALMYAVVVCTFVHREMKPKQLADAMGESAILIGSLILIVVLAFGLNDFLAEIEAATRMGTWLREAGLSPFMFLLVVNIALIAIGALMDSVSATLVFAPLLAPIAIDVYGIDPVHFGVVFVVNMEIGYLMPPVATNLFVGAAIFKEPFGKVARAVMPTLAIVCVALIALMYVPTLSTGALNAKRGKPIITPFPWNGKQTAVVAVPQSPDVKQPKKAMTMEEMMRAAEATLDGGSAAVEPEPAPPPKKAMTMEEMMRAADEEIARQKAAAEDAGI
ncbi:MAG: TRAP transporter large permease [Archangium sp.]